MSVVIDAENQILGRLASFAAKKAMLGEKVDVVNAEKAIITGTRQEVMEKYKQRHSRGSPTTGPHISRQPDRFVRRSIRGMLPYKKPRGKEAFRNVKCHIGVPEEFEGSKFENLADNTDRSKLRNLKYVYVRDVCQELGAKVE